ncbi:MAG: hypothetical protein HGB00_04625 [Chlorobiaceae bacterium]|nr:hypothetical protein [Chlorobiaceae bacterium]
MPAKPAYNNISGTHGADYLYGTTGADNIKAFSGIDLLLGDGYDNGLIFQADWPPDFTPGYLARPGMSITLGGDKIQGGADSDFLFGDTLYADAATGASITFGYDRISGGEGDDLISGDIDTDIT